MSRHVRGTMLREVEEVEKPDPSLPPLPMKGWQKANAARRAKAAARRAEKDAGKNNQD